jgi:hypothetical protein
VWRCYGGLAAAASGVASVRRRRQSGRWRRRKSSRRVLTNRRCVPNQPARTCSGFSVLLEHHLDAASILVSLGDAQHVLDSVFADVLDGAQ